MRCHTADLSIVGPPAFLPKFPENGRKGTMAREYRVARLLSRSRCLAVNGCPIVSVCGVITSNTYMSFKTALGLGEIVNAIVLQRQPIISSRVLMMVLDSLTASGPSAARIFGDHFCFLRDEFASAELHPVVDICVTRRVSIRVRRAGV